MSDELDRYFTALRHDSDSTVLTGADDIRRVGARRTRNRHIASAGVACLAVAAVVVGVATLTRNTGPAGQTPAAVSNNKPAVPTTPDRPPVTTPVPSTPPTSKAPAPNHTTAACTVADFGHASAMSDSAMGTTVWVVSFTNVGPAACTLGVLPTVWLVDPGTGHSVLLRDGNPYQAPHAHGKVTLRPGDQITTALSMGTVALETQDPASCAHTVTYQTMKVQLAGGVFTARHLGMSYSCDGLHGAGPDAGDWTK